MKRGTIRRKFAAVLLFSIAGALVLATAQLVFGVKLDDAMRRGADLISVRSDVVAIEQPMRLSGSPAVILSAGTLRTERSVDGRRSVATLKGPVIEVSLGTASVPSAEELTSGVLVPLLGVLKDAEVTKIVLRHGTLVLRWSGGGEARLVDFDAEVATHAKTAFTATGQFSYRGQVAKFDGSAAARDAGWLVHLNVKSPLLDVSSDGVLETVGAWSYAAETEMHSPDTTKLAGWLGYGWGETAPGPALLVKGPARWSRGILSFGKSRISLSDQDGVGAVTISYRDNRPLIEASMAFPALDVAPLLYKTSESAKSANASLVPVAQRAELPVWRCLATRFPAAQKIDTDLRISAARLQWRGEPIGKGALSISGRSGLINADFSELDLSAYVGNLQATIDETGQNAPVALRGRFQAKEVAPIATQLFGAALLKGSGSIQFELAGAGGTLGEVIDGASGRGSFEVRDGQLPLDLAAVQKLIAAAPLTKAVGGWGAVSGGSAFDVLAGKFQLRDGAAILDEVGLRGNGLGGVASGRIGFASSDLSVRIRVGALGNEGAVPAPGARVTPAATRAQFRAQGDALSIRGPWSAPVLSVVSPGSLP